MQPGDHLEDLLAQALAAHDAGPDQLAAFLDQHAQHRTVLERGLLRCQQMGLLGSGTTSDDRRDFPDRLGPFRLLRRLGSGGMGTVYEALQDDLGRKVALKVIRPELLYVAGARERFRREIDAISHLDHPAIVGIVAAGEHEGIPYFAMQLLAGATVAEATAPLRGRPLAGLRGSDLQQAIVAAQGGSGDAADGAPPAVFAGNYWQAAVQLIAQVARGLAHAHAHGIVHRDLKPSNVMLMPDGRAIVLDFGIARVRGARDLTRSAEPGSPAFMSPEQLRGEPTDERTDIYSLGLTLWQLLTREPPFADRRSESDLLRGDLPPLALERGAPRDLGIVLRMATDRDRQHRYRSMADFTADLQAVLARTPIRGRSLPWSLRTVRLVQRHRVASAVVATLAVAAIAVPFVMRAERLAAERSVAAAAERAEQSLVATLDTLAANEERMGGTNLPDLAEVDPLARTMLADSLLRYRELLASHRDHPRLQRQAAAAMYRSGQVQSRAGDAKAATALYDEALATLGTLPGDAPSETYELRGLVHLGLAAIAARQQDLVALRQHCEHAERDFVVLKARAPDSIAALRSHSELAVYMAKLYPGRDQVAEHEQHLRSALSLAEAWLATEPDSIDARIACVRRHSSLGVLLRRAGKVDAAAEHLLAAVTLSRLLPDNNRLWPPPRALQSMALESYANLLIDRRDPAALPLLEECVALREALTERLPEQTVFRVHLGNAYQNLGRALLAQGDADRAESWLRRACDVQLAILDRQPDYADAQLRLEHHRYALASCLDQLGRVDELIANGEQLAQRTGSSVALHTAAWSFLRAIALAGERAPARLPELLERYRGRSMGLLTATAAAGWDPVWRLADPVYDPVRQLPEFAALQERIAAPGK